jgi:arsenate reductase (thioredoxin)
LSGPSAGSADPIRVIFVCTGNSARSQMAEAILRRDGGDLFEVVSAGVDPRGVNPLTIRALDHAGIDIRGARSKSVEEFVGQPFDYVITVCDRARESCPYFPGGRETLHWGFDDPADAEGTDAQRLAVFERVMGEIAKRIKTFIPLARRARSGALSS